MEIEYSSEKKELSPQEELLRVVRGVKAMGDGEPIYQDTTIDLEVCNPEDLHPSALYLLKSNMDFVEKMYKDLLTKGIDILNLDQIVEAEGYVIAPPVVEIWDGQAVIVDGIHRIAMARKMGVSIKVIVVSGVRENRPLISYPVEWKEVITYDTKPEKAELLRKMRIDNQDTVSKLKCFRDFTPLTKKENRRPLSWETR
ncbi:MAG TPA: hypothetical protein VLH94_04470 [Spirochaetia bacterium]|nr:hypothetical protein [Spirochaetia bacterium]